MTKMHWSSQRLTLAHMSSELSGQLFTPVAPVCSWFFSWRVTTGHLPTRPKCDGHLFASPLFLAFGESRRPFLQFPLRMASALCALFHSLLDCARCYILSRRHAMTSRASSSRPCGFDGANPKSWRVFSQRRKSTWLVSGRSKSKQLQSNHLPASGTHVLGLACWLFCKIRFFQIFVFSWSSQRRPPTRRSSSFHTFPLETECSSITTADLTAHHRLGCIWPFPFGRHAMCYLEHQGCRCFFLQMEEQRFWTRMSQETLGRQQHLMSPGGARKERISSSYSGWLHEIVFGTLIPDKENAGLSAICIYKDLLLEEVIATPLVTCHGRWKKSAKFWAPHSSRCQSFGLLSKLWLVIT